MRCAWKELLAILPAWLQKELSGTENILQELRLRSHSPPELVLQGGCRWLRRPAQQEDINFIINTASRYSPWAASSIAKGYLTSQGGHRIGLCGEAVCQNGIMTGMRNVTSLCIRVARDFPGIADDLAGVKGSVMILGAPGWGKTTLLRDLIRQRSDSGEHVAVVDERGELFPGTGQSRSFSAGSKTDVLTGCPKGTGIDMLLRTMGPGCIAVDEITEEADCNALIRAARCGVSMLATAHASSIEDYLRRSVYKPLAEQGIFETIAILRRDKSWHTERRTGWITNGSVRC